MILADAYRLADLVTDSRIGPIILADACQWHRLAVKHYGNHDALIHLGHVIACVIWR